MRGRHRRTRLRSALTTLGILIGVAAVIILVAVGTGSSAAVQDSISCLGSNTLTVTAGATAAAAAGGGFGGPVAAVRPLSAGTRPPARTPARQTRAAELTMDDAEALATSDRGTATSLGVAPVVSAQSVTATYDGRLPHGQHLHRHDRRATC